MTALRNLIHAVLFLLCLFLPVIYVTSVIGSFILAAILIAYAKP